MVLTAAGLARKAIVLGGVADGERATTYDATVGSIIKCGKEIKEPSVILKPREIIWLVSNETFDLGDSTTGLATLKTQWTHQGVLALNVGIVDPGWNGPLAAAVVNFSSSDFEIEVGKPFLRLLFHDHDVIPAAELKRYTVARDEYVRRVIEYSKSFSDTFLDMNGLSRTVADEVLGMPRWGLILSLVAVVVGLLAISIPVGVSIWTKDSDDIEKIAALQARVSALEGHVDPKWVERSKCVRGLSAGKPKLICPAE